MRTKAKDLPDSQSLSGFLPDLHRSLIGASYVNQRLLHKASEAGLAQWAGSSMGKESPSKAVCVTEEVFSSAAVPSCLLLKVGTVYGLEPPTH